MVGDERRTFEFEADLAKPGENARYDFVEPLWAARRVGEIIDEIDLRGKNPELIDELVRLSTRYGILTPYTSFLADEETDLHAFGLNTRRAGQQLSRLEQVQGAAGVGQRSNKAYYQRTDRAIVADSLSALPGPVAGTQAPGFGGGFGGGMTGGRAGMAGMAGMGGMGGMGGAGLNASARVAMAVARDFEGNAVPVATVRQIGSKTFFYREGRWLDSGVTPEQEKKARVITQFSEPYFALSRSLPATSNQYLSFRQPVVVELGGTVYRIVPLDTDAGAN